MSNDTPVTLAECIEHWDNEIKSYGSFDDLRQVMVATLSHLRASAAKAGEGVTLPVTVRELLRFRFCTSYNASYFGEPAGLVKRAIADLERAAPGEAKCEPKHCPKCDRMVTSGCNYCACPYPQDCAPSPEQQGKPVCGGKGYFVIENGSDLVDGLTPCPGCPDCAPSPERVSPAELSCAIAFARLELLELDAGKRTLTQCPGVENVARAIAAAKWHA